MGLPVAELRSRIAEAALLTAEDVRAFETSLAAPPADAEAFAKELVRGKRLTSYQAQALLQNKAKTLVLGNYVVLDKLGQGGMGMVLKAEHRRMKRVVALKVLSPNLTRTAAAVARFHREVQAAARLNHPHVVTAFDADEAKGVHFLVMEFVDGKDLSSLVKSVGPMAVDDAVRCIRQAALGLQYAHENGVVHRDIKPANLLLDKSGHVKILDMGLARIEDADQKGEELTASGQIMGTAEYMSPEQALDTRHADARSDVYSLGCALFYLLTGRSVYGGDTAMKKLLAHRDAPIPSLVEAVRERANKAGTGTSNASLASSNATDALLRAVDALFRKMVAKSPADRPQTMAEVVAGLDRCLSQPEIAAADESESSDSHLHAFLRHMSEEQSLASLSPRTLPPSRGPNPGPGLEEFVQKLPGAQAVAAARPDPASKPTAELQGNRSTQPDRGVPTPSDKKPTGTANDLPPKTAAARGAASKKSSPGSPGPAWQHDRRVQLGLGGIALFVVVLAAIGISAFRGRPAPTGTGPDGTTRVADPNGGTDPVVDGNGTHASPPKTDFASDPTAPPPAVAPFDAVQAKAHQDAWAKHLGEPVETTNSIGMKFVVIPPGKFAMGEAPNAVPVELTRPFRLGMHEVTQGQFRDVLGAEPWKGKPDVKEGAGHAASYVNWTEAMAFCTKLTERERAAGRLGQGEEYRLPTEAEWEHACRVGTTTEYSFGADASRLGEYAWYDANAQKIGESYAHAVGLKKPNPWGLFDMHGNVWEWCGDWHGDNLPGGRDPVAPSEGSRRVIRGVGWFNTAVMCRSACRDGNAPWNRRSILGFRVVRTVAPRAVAAKPVAAAGAGGVPIDLLRLIDVEKDGLTGTWTWNDRRELTVGGDDREKSLQIPYRPPAEYDLRVAWTKHKGSAVRQQLVGGGNPFQFVIGAFGGKNGFEYIAGRGIFNEPANPTQFVRADVSKPGQRFESLIEVRKDRVRALSGGELLTEWKTDYSDFGLKPVERLPELTLGLRVAADATFHRIEVVEIGGPGTFLRPDDPAAKAAAERRSNGPAPALAPFDAAQAKAHQAAWAAHLGEPVETTNSVGMKFVVIPPGEFVMGTPKSDPGLKPEPQHRVRITRPILLGSTEVTHRQFRAVMQQHPDDDLPAGNMTWDQAAEFCRKLSDLPAERDAGRRYRLPTEAEWEYACRAGTTTRFSFGDQLAGAQAAVDQKAPRPVGSFPPNAWGLHDMHGNYSEWCADRYAADYYATSPIDDPPGPAEGSGRVFRGGSHNQPAVVARSGRRAGSDTPAADRGFRVVCELRRKSSPPIATAPFDEAAAKAHQAAWAKYLGEPVETTNSIGMKFVVIPPGKFVMGEGADAVPVELTRAFRLGMYEVTQGQFKAVMGVEPWKGNPDVKEGADHAASYVSWDDATAFCRKLTDRERAAGRLSATEEYRLPTEAEWEHACRAGTTTAYSFGDDPARLGEYAWHDANAKNAGESYAHAVGLKKPNAWGLFDMHGNVWEWCGDWHGTKLSGGRDPVGPSEGSSRVNRGGGWGGTAGHFRSAYRGWSSPGYRDLNLGFRVVRTIAQTKVAATTGASSPTFFNGKDLTGWIGDPTVWRVENGEIVGTHPPGPRSTAHLHTDRAYRDFELSFEVKGAVDAAVAVRGTPAEPDKPNGPAVTLGDKWGSLWLAGKFQGGYPEVAQAAAKAEYVPIAIRCVGQRLKTTVNGVKALDREFELPPRAASAGRSSRRPARCGSATCGSSTGVPHPHRRFPVPFPRSMERRPRRIGRHGRSTSASRSRRRTRSA